MLLSNDVGQPLAGRLILWIEAKMIVDQMCWVQTVLGYTALGYTALEVLVHGLHFFRRGGTAFEGRPIWVLVLLKRWIIFDECQFANWRVSAGEGQGKQSGHPRQHPCDPLRQKRQLIIRDQSSLLWAAWFCLRCIVHYRKQRSLLSLQLISNDGTLF